MVIVRGASTKVSVQGVILRHSVSRQRLASAVSSDESSPSIAPQDGGSGTSTHGSIELIERAEGREGKRGGARGPSVGMCVKVQQGRLRLTDCSIRSERGSGVLVRGSGQICLVNSRVGRCGHHGVTAIDGGLVEAEGCEVVCNKLSGINAIGKGSCVRSVGCRVHGNEDGGFNVVQGALALTSRSEITHNRGTGVRSMGRCSWAVKTMCVISGNGWHGLSVVEGGQAIVDDCTVMNNGGAGVNAFAEGTATLSRSKVQHNRYGVWAQNHGVVRSHASLIGLNEDGNEVTLAGGAHLGSPGC